MYLYISYFDELLYAYFIGRKTTRRVSLVVLVGSLFFFFPRIASLSFSLPGRRANDQQKQSIQMPGGAAKQQRLQRERQRPGDAEENRRSLEQAESEKSRCQIIQEEEPAPLHTKMEQREQAESAISNERTFWSKGRPALVSVFYVCVYLLLIFVFFVCRDHTTPRRAMVENYKRT